MPLSIEEKCICNCHDMNVMNCKALEYAAIEEKKKRIE